MEEYSLSECEQVVMKCIWDSAEDLGVSQITGIVNETYKKGWKQQTVSTFLVRLVKKEFLEMHRKGRYFYYHPKVTKEQFRDQILKDYFGFWNNGDAATFVKGLFESDVLTKLQKREVKEQVSVQNV